ncbi:hypothetical protein CYMTET_22964 [Cymbomonas tetramitiformis]|uniref:Uncharacterized protein n=1 Tax=Cymbomonas tetramitiformis TaxID=36881 RepID=A0AAE0FZ68_9CHLO|nr:hypothetical protein CYMTET_22964 [Cymbomonas tetramitiformis]
MIRSYLGEHAPERLKGFSVSDSWTKALLYAINLTPRKGTSNRKEPSDWEEQIELMVLQIAYIAEKENIPPALITAFDHIGLQIMPVRNQTWAEVNADTVPLMHLDDYRQITGVVAEAMNDDMGGVVLGMQLVYQGTTDKCLPARDIRNNGDFPAVYSPGVMAYPMTYTYNHWADEETNMELFEALIIPYLQQTKVRLSLPPDQKAITLLDCWPVQKTASFRSRVKTRYPWLLLRYIPPKCTGKGQKFDVDGGGIVKPKIVARAQKYVESEFTRQMKEGIPADKVNVDVRLGTIKQRHLYWVKESMTEFAANMPARKKGWEKTRVPNAFTDAYKARARELHAQGKLFPPLPVPADDEEQPDPASDDISNEEQVDEDPGLLKRPVENVAACTGLWEARQGVDSDDEEEGELELADMTVGTFAISFADGKDEVAFQSEKKKRME